MPETSSALYDATEVKQLGYEQELERNHNRWLVLPLGFLVLGSADRIGRSWASHS
jgi:hypothetical protein